MLSVTKQSKNFIALARFYSSKPPLMQRGPAPPKLEGEEQDEYEKLIQAANTQMTIEIYNEEHGHESPEAPPKISSSDIGNFGNILKTIPEFEGDINPKTGEVNGPKQDPLKHADEWSFNGRVTDF